MANLLGARRPVIEMVEEALLEIDGGQVLNSSGVQVVNSNGDPLWWWYNLTQLAPHRLAGEQVNPEMIPWVHVEGDTSQVDYDAAVNNGSVEHLFDVKVWLEVRPDPARWGTATAEDLLEILIAEVLAAVDLYAQASGCGSIVKATADPLIDDLGAFGIAEVTLTYKLRPRKAA